MNSQSIATYIANLEKENAELKERLRKCEEEKAILEYETMLHYAEVSDDESVASDSDSEYETESEPESESESESESDDNFFVCYNLPLTEAFDELAKEEENEYKKAVYERAANLIYHLDFKVTNGEELSHMCGIGKGTVRKINEFLETPRHSLRMKTLPSNWNCSRTLRKTLTRVRLTRKPLTLSVNFNSKSRTAVTSPKDPKRYLVSVKVSHAKSMNTS
jgi:hypothetical protein